MAPNKETFFQELEDLDCPSSDGYICDSLYDTLGVPVVPTADHSAKTPVSWHATKTAAKISLPDSANQPEPSGIDSDEVTMKREIALSKAPQNKASSMKRSLDSKEPGAGARELKRQRTDVKFVPEERRILKDLSTLVFIPNDDVAPARRLRIQRSREHGALWARQWGNDVTHIIAEKELTFRDVLKFLGIDRIPSNVVLVNRDYPSECLRFSQVINPTQARFRVKDAPIEKTDNYENSPRCTETLKTSGQLKESKIRVRRSSSPVRSEPSPRKSIQASPGVAQISDHPAAEQDQDPLNDIISEVVGLGNLPFASSDEEDLGLTISISSSQNTLKIDQLEHREKTRENTKVAQQLPDWQQTFHCMQPPLPEKGVQNPNNRTIEILQQMMAYYDQTADHWRTIAYRKCISALRRQPFKVSTKKQALVLPGIGERLAEKIEEVVCTDRLRRLENTNLTSEDKAIQLFLGVYGVGFAQASRWVAQGYRSLEDLNTKAKLTRNQRIGLDRYDDFQSRIPREEVHMHGDLVRQAVLRVDNRMRVIIGGSYRRGAADSGDIDCLVTRPGTTVEFIRTVMMDTVIPSLFREGFLKASLAASSRHGSSKWNGASCLPGHNTWRRIDLLFVPGDEIGAAILYFTGNDIFNRSMRLLARKKGMCLNQHGLYKDVIRNKYAGKESAGTLVEARDERKIFEVLGVPWREPEQRIC